MGRGPNGLEMKAQLQPVGRPKNHEIQLMRTIKRLTLRFFGRDQ